MIISKEFSFGTLFIHDFYVISVMKEGITVKPEDNNILKEISETYFKNKKFGYISNRLNSYSVDPSVYILSSKIENLISFAVITNDPINLLNTEIEKMFFTKPFAHFYTLEEAICWVELTVKKSKETIKK